MKTAIILLSVVLGALALTDQEVGQQWAKFKVEHKKSYKSAIEDMYRLNVFKKNLEIIEAHNELYKNGLTTYTKGVNQFADMTESEFMEYINKFAAFRPQKSEYDVEFKPSPTANVPDSIDWREKGAVTPVVDQKQCGSCWAFSTVGALEGLNILKNGDKTPLSQQNLVDCAGAKYGNAGCDGGFMDGAFDYVRDNGIESAANYPYTARDGTCKFDKKKSILTVSGRSNIPSGSESSLKEAVGTKQPISVAIEATLELQLYASGILSDKTCRSGAETLNHGVLAVGYGSQNGVDYWLIKNSWGSSWGEQGYFKLPRNANNKCGVATASSYPLA